MRACTITYTNKIMQVHSEIHLQIEMDTCTYPTIHKLMCITYLYTYGPTVNDHIYLFKFFLTIVAIESSSVHNIGQRTHFEVTLISFYLRNRNFQYIQKHLK